MILIGREKTRCLRLELLASFLPLLAYAILWYTASKLNELQGEADNFPRSPEPGTLHWCPTFIVPLCNETYLPARNFIYVPSQMSQPSQTCHPEKQRSITHNVLVPNVSNSAEATPQNNESYPNCLLLDNGRGTPYTCLQQASCPILTTGKEGLQFFILRYLQSLFAPRTHVRMAFSHPGHL